MSVVWNFLAHLLAHLLPPLGWRRSLAPTLGWEWIPMLLWVTVATIILGVMLVKHFHVQWSTWRGLGFVGAVLFLVLPACFALWYGAQDTIHQLETATQGKEQQIVSLQDTIHQLETATQGKEPPAAAPLSIKYEDLPLHGQRIVAKVSGPTCDSLQVDAGVQDHFALCGMYIEGLRNVVTTDLISLSLQFDSWAVDIRPEFFGGWTKDPRMKKAAAFTSSLSPTSIPAGRFYIPPFFGVHIPESCSNIKLSVAYGKDRHTDVEFTWITPNK